MYGNITLRVRHETGREEKIPNVRYARERDEQKLEILVVDPVNNSTYHEEYDALSWSIIGVSHTEIPPSEK